MTKSEALKFLDDAIELAKRRANPRWLDVGGYRRGSVPVNFGQLVTLCMMPEITGCVMRDESGEPMLNAKGEPINVFGSILHQIARSKPRRLIRLSVPEIEGLRKAIEAAPTKKGGK